jgi:hypothetical protein
MTKGNDMQDTDGNVITLVPRHEAAGEPLYYLTPQGQVAALAGMLTSKGEAALRVTEPEAE